MLFIYTFLFSSIFFLKYLSPFLCLRTFNQKVTGLITCY